MKTKLLILLVVVSTLFIGCQTTPKSVDTIELNSGQKIKVTFDGSIDETTHQLFLNYIKMDAEAHYLTSADPYTFRHHNIARK